RPATSACIPWVTTARATALPTWCLRSPLPGGQLGLRRERRSAWQASSRNLVGQGHALMGTPRVGAHPAGARYHGGMDTYLLADAFEVLLRGGGFVLGWILLIL